MGYLVLVKMLTCAPIINFKTTEEGWRRDFDLKIIIQETALKDLTILKLKGLTNYILFLIYLGQQNYFYFSVVHIHL